MLQRRPGGLDNNEVLEAYPFLFKPSGTDFMLLGSSPVSLLRSPVFLRGTEQLAFSLLVCLCWGLTSQSTIFQSCRDGATDGATASWVISQYFRGVKCLAQGHNTAAVGIEPPTSRSGVRHSTTEPPRSPSLLVITSGGIGNSGERSRSQMRAGFVFDTLTGGYVSGVETGNVTQKPTCSHAMRIMEEASWSGQVWRRTGAPTSLLFQEYWPDNATSTRSYVLMWCLSYAQWATMASSKMTTQGRIGQELSTDFCKLTMWGV